MNTRFLQDTVAAMNAIHPQDMDVVPDEIQDRLLEIEYAIEETITSTDELVVQETLEMVENMLSDLRKELVEQFANN